MTDPSTQPLSEFEVALLAALRIYLIGEDGYARVPGRRDSQREISAATARYVYEQSHLADFLIVYPDASHSWFFLREGRVERLRAPEPEDDVPWASEGWSS